MRLQPGRPDRMHEADNTSFDRSIKFPNEIGLSNGFGHHMMANGYDRGIDIEIGRLGAADLSLYGGLYISKSVLEARRWHSLPVNVSDRHTLFSGRDDIRMDDPAFTAQVI